MTTTNFAIAALNEINTDAIFIFRLSFPLQRVLPRDLLPHFVHVRGDSEESRDVFGPSLQLGDDKLGIDPRIPHAQTHHSRIQNQQEVSEFIRLAHRANQSLLAGGFCPVSSLRAPSLSGASPSLCADVINGRVRIEG